MLYEDEQCCARMRPQPRPLTLGRAVTALHPQDFFIEVQGIASPAEGQGASSPLQG